MTEPPLVEVALALVWRGGRLLVTRRPEGTHLGGYWEFPGGKLAPGETPEACAVREAREEVGVECVARARRASSRHAYPERTVVLHPVDCDFVSGEPRALEVVEFAWVMPEELEGYELPPANAPLVAELRRRR